jgi:fibronectin type 3 domain-containing protein
MSKFTEVLYVLLILTILLTIGGCGDGGGNGSAQLTWDAPTTNTDETPLTDLDGYKVYYGTSSGSYTTSINVGNVTTYTVTGLSSGTTYYFAVTAYDLSANESDYSNEVNKTIS